MREGGVATAEEWEDTEDGRKRGRERAGEAERRSAVRVGGDGEFFIVDHGVDEGAVGVGGVAGDDAGAGVAATVVEIERVAGGAGVEDDERTAVGERGGFGGLQKGEAEAAAAVGAEDEKFLEFAAVAGVGFLRELELDAADDAGGVVTGDEEQARAGGDGRDDAGPVGGEPGVGEREEEADGGAALDGVAEESGERGEVGGWGGGGEGGESGGHFSRERNLNQRDREAWIAPFLARRCSLCLRAPWCSLRGG